MNGFEPLRRRIIDYTDAGQWFEVYDGPIESCETEQLKAENAKLRELCKELAEFLTEAEWLQWPELRAEMQRLGVEASDG